MTPPRICAAALASLPFGISLLILAALSPPTPENWAWADPILKLAPPSPTLWGIPALGLIVASAWLRMQPSAPVRHDALAGALTAVLVVSALRLLCGPSLPGFIPPEESSRPGLALGLAAGYGEEIVFRLGLLPLLYFLMRGRLPRLLATAVPVLATGLAFALLHAAGEPVWHGSLFATRMLLPGCLMSVGCFVLSPTFVMVGHCTAHLLFPLLL